MPGAVHKGAALKQRGMVKAKNLCEKESVETYIGDDAGKCFQLAHCAFLAWDGTISSVVVLPLTQFCNIELFGFLFWIFAKICNPLANTTDILQKKLVGVREASGNQTCWMILVLSSNQNQFLRCQLML